uniref:Putative ovule protein n=1 Tax=Solanum chacoense TaxID=4108 RepID=A0A0V0GXX1_SOLCH
MVSPCLWRIAQGSQKGMDIIVENASREGCSHFLLVEARLNQRLQLDSHHCIPMFYGLYRLQPIDGRHL